MEVFNGEMGACGPDCSSDRSSQSTFALKAKFNRDLRFLHSTFQCMNLFLLFSPDSVCIIPEEVGSKCSIIGTIVVALRRGPPPSFLGTEGRERLDILSLLRVVDTVLKTNTSQEKDIHV